MDETFKHSSLHRTTEYDCPEGLSIDRAVGVQDGLAKLTHNAAPRRFAWEDDLSRQFIGIDDDGPALLEHLRDSTFPGGNTPVSPINIMAAELITRQA